MLTISTFGSLLAVTGCLAVTCRGQNEEKASQAVYVELKRPGFVASRLDVSQIAYGSESCLLVAAGASKYAPATDRDQVANRGAVFFGRWASLAERPAEEWFAEGKMPGDYFGSDVAMTALSGSLLQVAIGSPQNGNAGCGYVGVYYGNGARRKLLEGTAVGDHFGERLLWRLPARHDIRDQAILLVSAPNANGGRGRIAAFEVDEEHIKPIWSSQPTGEAFAFGQQLIGVGDIDGDGQDDSYVISSLGERASLVSAISCSSGNIQFEVAIDFPMRNGGGDCRAIAAAGDWNGDGMDEILVACRDGDKVDVLSPPSGKKLLSFELKEGTCADGLWLRTCGDVDGDGKGDSLIGMAGRPLSGGRETRSELYLLSTKAHDIAPISLLDVPADLSAGIVLGWPEPGASTYVVGGMGVLRVGLWNLPVVGAQH